MKGNRQKRAGKHFPATVIMIALVFGPVMLALAAFTPANSANATPGGHPGGDDAEILVFAASSLAPPLQQIALLCRQGGGAAARFSFASSAALARQIEYGAPANLFITAHPRWLERLARQRRIKMTEVRAIAANRLVLAGAADRLAKGSTVVTTATTDIRALLLAPGTGRIATGDPASVPLGMYARSSLTALGLWQSVSPRLAPAANARAALLQVERGLARLGILYASDLAGSRRAVMLAEMPAHSYGPIAYLAAPVAQPGGTKTVAAFLDCLTSPAAAEIFLQHGFSPRQ